MQVESANFGSGMGLTDVCFDTRTSIPPHVYRRYNPSMVIPAADESSNNEDESTDDERNDVSSGAAGGLECSGTL